LYWALPNPPLAATTRRGQSICSNLAPIRRLHRAVAGVFVLAFPTLLEPRHRRRRRMAQSVFHLAPLTHHGDFRVVPRANRWSVPDSGHTAVTRPFQDPLGRLDFGGVNMVEAHFRPRRATVGCERGST
jgi:hypothetical protein